MAVLGWVINISEDKFPEVETHQEERMQPAVFYLDGVPVWEVWYYSSTIRKWLVMTEMEPLNYPKNEIIFYSSSEELKAAVAAELRKPESRA